MSCIEVDAASEPIDEADLLAVRRGPGANCSSIGSALDVLFLTAAVAGVVLAATAAAMSVRAPAGDKNTVKQASDDDRAREG